MQNHYLSTFPPKNAPAFEDVPKLSNFSELLDYCAKTYGDQPAFQSTQPISSANTTSRQSASGRSTSTQYNSERSASVQSVSKHTAQTPDQITFSEFSDSVSRLAAFLKTQYQNSHIALISENSVDFLLFFFAIVLSGNVVAIIDKDETDQKISEMLKTADISAVFTSSKKYPHISIIPQIPEKVNTICTFEEILAKLTDTNALSSSATQSHTSAYANSNQNRLKNNQNHFENNHNHDETNHNQSKNKHERVSVIFFTSGTTGKNKAVMLTEQNICADIYAAASLYRPYGNVVAFLPFHHAFGLVTAALMPFFYGKTAYISGSLKSVAKDLKDQKPQTIFAVPAVIELFYRQIWRTAKKTGADQKLTLALKLARFLPPISLRRRLFRSVLDSFGGLEVIICGGAYLDQKYIDFFDTLGVNLLNGYGITECSPVVSVNRVNFKRKHSVGQLCRDTEIQIKDGEILISSDYVMQGYYNNPEATKEALESPETTTATPKTPKSTRTAAGSASKRWLRTGDLGHIDQDGFLFITGRKKDLIILSNGENISPEGIESEFLHEESVRECLVFEENGQLVIEIFPTEDYLENQAHFDQLVERYNKPRPRNHQLARAVLRTTEFPKNNNTKILRHRS